MTGLLLIQLGTPDEPTATALKPYLRQFLSDPRVIENQGWRWKLILRFFILRKRPAQSAAKYARIWDAKTGSPLLHYTRRQAERHGGRAHHGLQQPRPDSLRPVQTRTRSPRRSHRVRRARQAR